MAPVKVLILVEYGNIYDDKKYFQKMLTLIQMKGITLPSYGVYTTEL